MKDSIPEKDYSIPKTLPHDRHERIVTSEGSGPSTVTQARPLVSIFKTFYSIGL
jgi:hypothetical protein